MDLKQKYEKWREIYLSTFVHEEDASKPGNYIPIESVNGDSGFAGDGPINIAYYITWAWLNDDKGRIEAALRTLRRLSDNAYAMYKNDLPVCKDMVKEDGFFLRDDFPADSHKLFSLAYLQSGYGGSILGINEDVCYSPFISQDQCWNLLPSLSSINAEAIGRDIFGYVVKNKHVIYNPYISQILHQHTYMDLGVDFYDRIEDRKKHLKYKVKVKRGANNWYFSYGFKKAFNRFGGNSKTFWSSLWYKPFIFLADRVYHPYICKWFGIKVKNTSYYSMAIGAGAWYAGDPHKRILKKMNDALEKGEVFLPEVFVHSKYAKDVNKEKLLEWLETYEEPNNERKYGSPIIFMILYSFYKSL